MTLLLEGVSLIFQNSIVEDQFPGGIAHFRAIWDNGSFCTDGKIFRISYFERRDAFDVLMVLPHYGIEVPSGIATDVAVILHGGGELAPCLWLETACEHGRVWVCWHSAARRADCVSVPAYFRARNSLSAYGNLSEHDLMAKITRKGSWKGVSLFQDQSSRRVLVGPNPLSRH